MTSSSFISLSFITPTPSHFLSLTLVFSVIINNNKGFDFDLTIHNKIKKILILKYKSLAR